MKHKTPGKQPSKQQVFNNVDKHTRPRKHRRDDFSSKDVICRREPYLQGFLLLLTFPTLVRQLSFLNLFTPLLSAYPLVNMEVNRTRSFPSQGSWFSRSFSRLPLDEPLIFLPEPEKTLFHWSSSSFSALSRPPSL